MMESLSQQELEKRRAYYRAKMERRNELSMADNDRDNFYMDNCRREERGQPKLTREEWEATRKTIE